MSRRKAPCERRRDLMNAGLRLFTTKGITATTVDAVTGAASVAKGTFYQYFPSKESLLGALQEQFVNELLERVNRDLQDIPLDDWPARLATWVRSGTAHYLENHHMHDVLFHHQTIDPTGDDPMAATTRRLAASLAAILSEGRMAGAFHVDDPPMTAVLLFSALHGVVDQSLHGRGSVDRDRLVRSLQDLAGRAVTEGDSHEKTS